MKILVVHFEKCFPGTFIVRHKLCQPTLNRIKFTDSRTSVSLWKTLKPSVGRQPVQARRSKIVEKNPVFIRCLRIRSFPGSCHLSPLQDIELFYDSNDSSPPAKLIRHKSKVSPVFLVNLSNNRLLALRSRRITYS